MKPCPDGRMGRDEVDTSLEAKMGVGFEVFTPDFAWPDGWPRRANE
jgi:hypothetical protein